MNWSSAHFRMLVVFLCLMVSRATLAQERIRLGLSSISATSGSIWVAEEKGLFKKHGANVEVIFIGGGGASAGRGRVAGGNSFFAGGGGGGVGPPLPGGGPRAPSSPT